MARHLPPGGEQPARYRKTTAVKAPGFGDRRKAMLEDIAILTSGTVIAEELGLKLENGVTLKDLGRAKIEVAKEDTTIIDGNGKKTTSRRAWPPFASRSRKPPATTTRKAARASVAKLAGGVAVIRVGAATRSRNEGKRRPIEDALHATSCSGGRRHRGWRRRGLPAHAPMQARSKVPTPTSKPVSRS